MAAVLHRVKTGIYITAVVVAIFLLVIRAINTSQKNNYITEPIESIDNEAEASLSFPKKIPGPRTESLYPLVITFSNQAPAQPADEYEFVFESPSLIFTNNAGVEIDPRLKISSDYGSMQKRIFIRPAPTENHLKSHIVEVKVLKNGQILATDPDTFSIAVESAIFSFFSLVASSILEISVVLGLTTLAIKALDDAQKARRDLMDQRRAEIQKLSSLPLLPQMRECMELWRKKSKEQWDEELVKEITAKHAAFSRPEFEREFFHTVGNLLVQGKLNELMDLDVLYAHYQNNHQQSIDVLTKLIFRLELNQDPLWLVSVLVKLWDDFDVDVKDLIIIALVQLSQKVDLSQLSRSELESQVFYDNESTKRFRLLRAVELRRVFPQLQPPPPNFDALWFHLKEPEQHGNVIAWLKQHYLVSNPFGEYDLKNYPFFPPGSRRPDQWLSFLSSSPLFGYCPSDEDVQPLAHRLRDECLRYGGNVKPLRTWQHIFPVLISPTQHVSLQQPLVTISHAVSHTWLSILPLSPDAMLDLPLPSQENVLELIFWSVGSKYAALNLLQQNVLRESAAHRLLKRKFSEYDSHLSPVTQPQEAVLLSWLKVRPPDLDRTFLILVDDNQEHSAFGEWFGHFSPVISALYLAGIVTKIIASVKKPYAESLSMIEFSWFDNNEKGLRKYLDGQFDAAMDPMEISLGKAVRFHELFGPGVTEEMTTDKLISAANCSLARLLRLGNQILQSHCHGDPPENFLSTETLNDILGMP